MPPRILIALALLPGLSGCASSAPSAPPLEPARPAGPAFTLRPARISHVVLFKLLDQALADDMLAECDALLPAIPGVISYASGTHLETGRDSVDGDYDGALYVGFMTEAAYAGYLDHPDHVELANRWSPHLEWMRIYDVLDETP